MQMIPLTKRTTTKLLVWRNLVTESLFKLYFRELKTKDIMLSSKKYAAWDSIISMRDEREYEKVKNRMKLAVKIADALKKQNMSQIIILLMIL